MALDVTLLFQIAGIGIIVLILDKVLDGAGKKEFATVVNIVGIILILMVVIYLVNQLFSTVRTMFQL